MADSAVQPNNAAVKYRGRAEREMPSVSKAKSAAMHAAAEGDSTIGIPKSVGEDFAAADHGRKISKLPKHVGKSAKKKAKRHIARGLISEKAAKAHFGEEA